MKPGYYYNVQYDAMRVIYPDGSFDYLAAGAWVWEKNCNVDIQLPALWTFEFIAPL